MREVLLWTGAGQIGMAIARRVGYGKTVVVGDRSLEHAQAAAGVMNAAGVSPSQAPYRDHSAGGSVRNRRPTGGGGTGHRPGGSGG